MKKIIVLALSMVMIISLFAACGRTERNDTYTLENCLVYDVDKYPGEIAIIDDEMDIWVWHDNIDVKIGEKCDLVMDNNDTPDYIFDDIVIEVIWNNQG